MLKNYMKKRGITTSALASSSGIAYSTLNDLVNGKVEIDKCRVLVLHALSGALGLSMDDLYTVCSGAPKHVDSSYGQEVKLCVKNKSYYANFEYDHEPVEIFLCKVNEDNSYYIEDIAKWRADEYIRNRRMKEFK